MNFKGSTFSLARGNLVSACEFDGIYHIFARRNGPICYMQFDSSNRSLRTVDGIVTAGEGCWLVDGILVEYVGGEVRNVQAQTV